MSALFVVFVAEFERRIRSRSFIFGTAIGALTIAAIALLPTFLSGSSSESKRIIVAGEPSLTAAAAALLKRDFTVVGTQRQPPKNPSIAFLDAHGKANALVWLRRDGTKLRTTLFTREPGNSRVTLSDDLGPLQVALAIGVPAERVAANTSVKVDERDISGRFTDASQAIAAKGVGYLFVMLLYLGILLNAQSIVSSVTEEKTSRIAELLVAAIDPAQLLLAKVLATSATGFIQLAVWLAAAFASGSAITGLFDSSSNPALQNAGITAADVVWFIVFFILGFTQCAVLFAAAGSLVNRSEDVGNVSGPLYIPVVGAIAIAQFAIQFPNAPFVVASSFVPLVSPFVMFTRITVGSVPAWQIAVAIALNLAACAFFAWFSGKVYRIGLLLYGRPPSPRQIVAAFRQR